VVYEWTQPQLHTGNDGAASEAPENSVVTAWLTELKETCERVGIDVTYPMRDNLPTPSGLAMAR
jgi:hypothetical protein